MDTSLAGTKELSAYKVTDEAVKAESDAVLDKVESIPSIVEEVRRLGGG